MVRETQPAGFPAQLGGGEKHEEKYEEIRQRFFFFFLHTDCFSRSIEIQLVVLQCDRCWWMKEDVYKTLPDQTICDQTFCCFGNMS